MNKHIFFLAGIMSFPVIGMDEPEPCYPCYWPPKDLRPQIIKYLYKPHNNYGKFENDCGTLACVNKELSKEIHYEKVLIAWKRELFKSPLFLIIEQRNNYNVKRCNLHKSEKCPLYQARRDQYLNVAERLLKQTKADSNYQLNHSWQTPLQKAADFQDKELVRLFLQYDGDPFKATLHFIPQGPGLNLNAFHYANKDRTEATQLNTQPDGWFKDMWDEMQKEKVQKSPSDVALLQSEDTTEAVGK